LGEYISYLSTHFFDSFVYITHAVQKAAAAKIAPKAGIFNTILTTPDRAKLKKNGKHKDENIFV
jgi:hypothetical protein